MRILEGRQGPEGSTVVALFGLGRIGAAVAAALERAGSRRVRDLELSWNAPERRPAQLAVIGSELRRHLADGVAGRRLSIVWTAGTIGFGATEDEAAGEGRTFGEVLGLAHSLAESLGQSSGQGSGQDAAEERTGRSAPGVSFHLVSSAGGLFEGQRRIGRASLPRPRRPYGWMKLRQERALLSASSALDKRIYRASSVYGPPHPSRRSSLVSTLVANGLLGRETTLFGRPETLRDFVWVGDVAELLAREALGRPGGGEGGVRYLVSGRPTTLLDVQRTVERSLGRRVGVRFSRDAWNAADITYAPHLVQPGGGRTDLATGVRRVVLAALTSGPTNTPPYTRAAR
jgi:NAD dependent epimerase/dehydratase family